jgi:hypothetical protein
MLDVSLFKIVMMNVTPFKIIQILNQNLALMKVRIPSVREITSVTFSQFESGTFTCGTRIW